MADLVLCSKWKVFQSINNRLYEPNTGRYHSCSEYNTSNIWGINYDINQTKEATEIKKVAAIEDLRNKIGEEGITILSSFADWPIWLQMVDPERAVILSWWNKVWCIDWVLDSIKRDPSCSLWRKKINIEFFSKARYLDGIIETLKREYETKMKVNCSEHNKATEIFWDDWDVFICSTCIVVSHNGHKLTEINTKYADIVKKIPDDLEQMEKHISSSESVISKIKTIDEKNKDFLLFKYEQALSVLPEIFKKHHKKSWDLYEDYEKNLNRRKEHFQEEKQKIEKTIKEDTICNAETLYQIQGKLKQENSVREAENQEWMKMIEDSPLTTEKYVFELAIPKSGETVEENWDNLIWELTAEEEKWIVKLTSIDQKPLKQKSQKYLIFITKSINLFNNDQNSIPVHKFLSPITLASPLTISLSQNPEGKNIKLLIYRSTQELIDYLISAHESLTSCLHKSLEETNELLLSLKKSNQVKA